MRTIKPKGRQKFGRQSIDPYVEFLRMRRFRDESRTPTFGKETRPVGAKVHTQTLQTARLVPQNYRDLRVRAPPYEGTDPT